MHELGIMAEVIRVVQQTAIEYNLHKVDKIRLQIGELTSVVPQYAEQLFPAAAYKTPLEGTKLEIEVIPGIGCCKECGTEFRVVENDGKCPKCMERNYDILSGREFLIKDIIAN